MAAEIEGVFKPNLRELILSSKILVVGAGGIGCEVLKNLVMCGFKDIEIVSKKDPAVTLKLMKIYSSRLIWTQSMSRI